MGDEWWETVSGVVSAMDAELRADAYEVFVAEAARGRVIDRRGEARVRVQSGELIVGTLVGDVDSLVEGHLVVRSARGRTSFIPVAAVVTMSGTRLGLRPDDDPGGRPVGVPRLTSRLREAWLAGERVRVLTRHGQWFVGVIVCVGADFADVECEGSVVTIPLRSADVWELG